MDEEAVQRRAQQDYEAIDLFLTKSAWERLNSLTGFRDRAECLCEFAYLKLWLRLPSERTFGSMVGLLRSYNVQEPTGWSLHQDLETLKGIWNTVKGRLSRRNPEPDELLKQLPLDFASLPPFIRDSFGAQRPAAGDERPFSPDKVARRAQRVPLRKTHSTISDVQGAGKALAALAALQQQAQLQQALPPNMVPLVVPQPRQFQRQPLPLEDARTPSKEPVDSKHPQSGGKSQELSMAIQPAWEHEKKMEKMGKGKEPDEQVSPNTMQGKLMAVAKAASKKKAESDRKRAAEATSSMEPPAKSRKKSQQAASPTKVNQGAMRKPAAAPPSRGKSSSVASPKKKSDAASKEAKSEGESALGGSASKEAKARPLRGSASKEAKAEVEKALPPPEEESPAYKLMWYKNTNKLAFRPTTGDKRQVCQFGRSGLSRAQLEEVAKDAMRRVARGKLQEQGMRSFCDRQMDKRWPS